MTEEKLQFLVANEVGVRAARRARRPARQGPPLRRRRRSRRDGPLAPRAAREHERQGLRRRGGADRDVLLAAAPQGDCRGIPAAGPGRDSPQRPDPLDFAPRLLEQGGLLRRGVPGVLPRDARRHPRAQLARSFRGADGPGLPDEDPDRRRPRRDGRPLALRRRPRRGRLRRRRERLCLRGGDALRPPRRRLVPDRKRDRRDVSGERVASGGQGAAVASLLDSQPDCSRCAYKPYHGVSPPLREQGDILGRGPTNTRCLVDKGILDCLFEKLQDGANEAIFRTWLEEDL